MTPAAQRLHIAMDKRYRPNRDYAPSLEQAVDGIIADPSAHLDDLVYAGVLERRRVVVTAEIVGGKFVSHAIRPEPTDVYTVIEPEPPHVHMWEFGMVGSCARVRCLGCQLQCVSPRNHDEGSQLRFLADWIEAQS